MRLKIYAQNALDGYSDPKTSKEYLGIIKRVQPDIALFTEAYKIDREGLIAGVSDQLQSLHYFVLSGLYDDQDGRKDKHGILLAIRSELVSTTKKPRLTRIGKRNIVECWLKPKAGKAIHFLGVHLNDRSEANRQTELNDLLQLIYPEATPTTVVGDLNSIHRSDARGAMFRKARRIHLLVRLKLMPKTDPTGDPMPNSLGRIGSIFYRLHEMASGKTIRRLEKHGFSDADISHLPTYPAHNPVAQLDHILVSHHFSVNRFDRLPAGSSDHLGIVATLEI